MIFNNYLENILGSKVKIKLVRALLNHPNQTYSGRELARQVEGISHMAVFKSLKDLIAFNLVKVEYHGGVQLIKLNRKSCLYKPLEFIFNYEETTRDQLIREIRKIFSKKKDMGAVVLFGSVAKGEEEIDSDIDLLIITEDKERTKDIIANNQKIFTEKFRNII